MTDPEKKGPDFTRGPVSRNGIHDQECQLLFKIDDLPV